MAFPVPRLTGPLGLPLRGWLAVLALFIAVLAAAGLWAERSGIERLRDGGTHRLDVYASGLASELGKYDYLPGLLSLNQDVLTLLRNPLVPGLRDVVNRQLERVNAQAKASALYVLDRRGITLAASNWNEETSFVGENLSYRPYFQDALERGRGRFYGIGTTSAKPGFYLSYAIRDGSDVLGVAALKVSLDALADAWSGASEHVLIADGNGVVFLSSDPTLKFKTLASLGPDVLAMIKAAPQYDGVALTPLDYVVESTVSEGARIVALGSDGEARRDQRFLELSRTIAEPGWRLLLMSDLKPVDALVRNALAFAAVVFAFVLLLYLYLRQRRRTIQQSLAVTQALQRAHDELELKVTERTADLVQANEQLQKEIAERRRAERVLREAQEELVQAGKMAVLGQMSAGITHELNQPLAALRTLSDNAQVLLERNRLSDVQKNLGTISQLIDRMGKITGQLKAFARKSPARLDPAMVHRAIANALFLLDQRLRTERVSVEQVFADEEVTALCDANRLEQVLINLLGNAIDAMKGAPLRLLTIGVRLAGSRIVINVRDTGAGIAPRILSRLFEPFCTSKEAGAGLGLGLAISAGIVREFGGTLTGTNLPGGGAEFVVELQAARVEQAHA